MAETNFDKKIKPIFAYVGTIGAVMATIAYVIIVFIMVFGISVSHSFSRTLIFAIINAAVGLVIIQFLKIQGIDLAKRLEKNKDILEQYNKNRAKVKKLHGLGWFWGTTIIKDVIIKCATLAATTLGIIYIVISASQDYTLLLLALVNIIMFACYGLLSLVKAYDFFNDEYIPFITEQMDEKNEKARIAAEEAIRKQQEEREKIIETEVKKRLDLAKKELIQQANDRLCDSGRDNILEPSVGVCPISPNSESMVLDNNNNDNSVLGGPIYASDRTTNIIHILTEENTSKNEIEEEIK